MWGARLVPVYSIAIIEFDDVSPAFTTTDTVGGSVVGNTYTIAGGAAPIAIFVDDDDPDFDDGFIDPPGNTTAANNQLIAEPVTINGVAYGPPVSGGTPEDQIELEFAFTTTDGDTYYVVRINGANVGLSGPTLPQAGQTFTIASSSDAQDTPYDAIPCFVAGTRILTPFGFAPVDGLQAGDLVVTVDDGPQPLVRNLTTSVSRARMAAMPALRPIVFAPGAAGNDTEMRISPQHRVLVTGWRAELLFGEPQVLVPAKALVNGRNVRISASDRDVCYHHLLFDRHQLVISDGAVTESLYPGGRVARGTRVEGLREFAALFGVDKGVTAGVSAPVRPMVAMREARALQQTAD